MAGEDAKVTITADGKAFSGGLAKMQKDLDTMANSVTARLARVGQAFGALAPVASAAFGAVGSVAGKAVGFVQESVEAAAEREQVRLRFKVLLGDEAAAEKFVKDLTALAGKTPLEMEGIFGVAGTLLSSTKLRGDELLQTIVEIGDMAVASGNRVEDVAEAFAKVHRQGVLSNETVETLERMNIPVKEILASWQEAGTTADDVFKQISKRQHGVESFMAVWKRASAGVGGMMEEQAETAAGRWSTLQDTLGELMVSLGEQMLPVLGKLTEVVTDAGGKLEGLFKALGEELAKVIGSDFAPWVQRTLGELVERAPDAVEAIREIGGQMQELVRDTLDAVDALGDFFAGVRKTWAYATGGLAGLEDALYEERIRKAQAFRPDESALEDGGADAGDADGAAAAAAATAAAEGEATLSAEQVREAKMAQADAAGRAASAAATAAKADEEYAAEVERRRKNWSESKSEARFRARDAGILDLPYERAAAEVDRIALKNGLHGELSEEGIRGEIDRYMSLDPVMYEDEIAELKRMLKLWQDLAKKREEYGRGQASGKREILAQYYELRGNAKMAGAVREYDERDRRKQELMGQGATSAEAERTAYIEGVMRQLAAARQARGGVEFLQHDGANVGSGATSIRLGDMQISETKKTNKLLKDVERYVEDIARGERKQYLVLA